MSNRVLLCRVDGNFGGAERHLLTLASKYDAQRYVPVIAPIANHGELEKQSIEHGYHTEFIPMNSRTEILQAGRAIVKAVRKHGIKLIHTFGIRSNTLAWLVHNKLNIPWVITLPNINTTDYTNPIQARVSHGWNNFLLRRADAVHVISPQLHDYISRIPLPPKNIYTIINGVDIPNNLETRDKNWIRTQYKLPSDSVIIGTTGRLEEVKAYDLLIQAFQRVHEKIPKACLVLVGDGSQRKQLEQQANSVGLNERIIFAGQTYEVWKYLAGMDLYVCSSRSEGVPYSILEAMAAGLPIVATGVGGIPSIINHEGEGILIPPNRVDELSNAVIHLLTTPDQAAHLGRNAKQRVNSEFTSRHMANQVMDMYDETLKRKAT